MDPPIKNIKTGSASGVATLLTVAHENIWGNMKIPGFENVLRSVPPALPDLMGILFKAAQEVKFGFYKMLAKPL